MSTVFPPDTGQQRTALVPLIRPEDLPPAGLPLPLTSFVGREREVAVASAALRRDGVRLITLIGPGGVGKTRLALRVAEEVAGHFPDYVWFVPLAPINDPALVTATVAGAIGVREASDRSLLAGLQTFLRDKRALLLLDNFEHLVEAASLATDLLTTCPALTILATSRSKLRLSGEHDLVVPPLALPDLACLPSLDDLNESPAMSLFVERARAARDDFVLTADNALAVAQICHRLDGLPLAIELAAARSGVLPPLALLSRLGQRLPLLTGGPRDSPARLRTMRDTIAWSHDLLNDDERMLFRRLAVFVGGCSFDAAETVCGGTKDDGRQTTAERTPVAQGESTIDSFLDVIASLVDKSLVRSFAIPAGATDAATHRIGMLETVREFGLEQLAASGEADIVGRRHASYYLRLVEMAEPLMRGPGQLAWFQRLEGELANLRAALGWLRDGGDIDGGLRFATALWTFWVVRGQVFEGRSWLESFLAKGGTGSAVRQKALVALGDLAQRLGDYDAALGWVEEAHVLARETGDRAGEAAALRGLGSIATSRGAHIFHALGDAILAEAELARAEAWLEQAVALARDGNDAWGTARGLMWLASLRWTRGDAAGAVAPCEEAKATFRRLGDRWPLSTVIAASAVLAKDAGDLTRARAGFAESLSLTRELGFHWQSGMSLVGLAAVAIADGEGEHAARLLGAASKLSESVGEQTRRSDRAWYDQWIDAARALAGEEGFAAARAAGAALPPDLAIAEALASAAPKQVVLLEPAAPSADGGLTSREFEVLRLLAAGQSDQQIAETLSIARTTASNHVAAIRAKFGVRSRAAAVAHAARHRLI